MRKEMPARNTWIGAAAAFMTLLCISIGAAHAQNNVLAGQHHFRVRLTSALSSESSVGSKVAAQVVAPQEFAGDILEGEVKEAQSSNLKNKESVLVFQFNQLFHKEEKIEIRGKVTDAYNSKGKKNVDEEGFKVQADTSLGDLLGNVSRIPFPGRRRPDAEKATTTAVAVAALLVKYTAKAPKIMFDTGSEFELDVSRRTPAPGN